VTPEQLASNMEALKLAKKLASDEGKDILKEVMEGCRMDSQIYWNNWSALAWN
jgi:hypothetical protein